MRKLRPLLPYLIVAAVLLLQSGKAFHIDDATFLAMARDAQKDPLHPYGAGVQSNPPGFAWLLAAMMTLFGDSERALHLALLPLTLLSLFAVDRLAREFKVRDGFSAALLFGLSGVVLLPASILMPDVPMTGAVAAVVALLLSDAREPKGWKLGLSTVLSVFAWTLRISAAPVLLLFFLVQLLRRKWRAAVPLVAVLASLFAWSLASRVQTGTAQTVTTAQLHGSSGAIFVWRFLSTAAALALFTPAALGAALLRPSRRSLELVALALFFIATFGSYPAALVAAGTALFVAARLRLPSFDLETLFLWGWFFGALAVPLLYNQAAAKFVTLALPPILVLILRNRSPGRALVWLTAGVSLAAAVATGIADERYANALRDLTYAQVAKERAEAPRAFVAGTPWGAEEYAPRAGGTFLWDELKPGTRSGELLRAGDEVLDLSHPGSLGIPQGAAVLVEQGALTDGYPIRTMSDGAGLWSSHFGLLPWTFSTGPVQPWWRVRIARALR
ncbi:MAG TPA: glycosyltransferase family 39 protein [Myxococcales bacterium]|jgi:hypothetical protein